MSVSDIVKTEEGFFYCDRYGFKTVNFDETLATKPKDLLHIVFVEPGKTAYAAEIENSLRAKQRAVGGMIEVVSNGVNRQVGQLGCAAEGGSVPMPEWTEYGESV